MSLLSFASCNYHLDLPYIGLSCNSLDISYINKMFLIQKDIKVGF